MSGAANEPEAPHSLFRGEIVCPMWQSVYTQCGMWMTASAGVGGWSLGNGNAGGSSYLGSGLALADARSCASGAMRDSWCVDSKRGLFLNTATLLFFPPRSLLIQAHLHNCICHLSHTLRSTFDPLPAHARPRLFASPSLRFGQVERRICDARETRFTLATREPMRRRV